MRYPVTHADLSPGSPCGTLPTALHGRRLAQGSPRPHCLQLLTLPPAADTASSCRHCLQLPTLPMLLA